MPITAGRRSLPSIVGRFATRVAGPPRAVGIRQRPQCPHPYPSPVSKALFFECEAGGRRGLCRASLGLQVLFEDPSEGMAVLNVGQGLQPDVVGAPPGRGSCARRDVRHVSDFRGGRCPQAPASSPEPGRGDVRAPGDPRPALFHVLGPGWQPSRCLRGARAPATLTAFACTASFHSRQVEEGRPGVRAFQQVPPSGLTVGCRRCRAQIHPRPIAASASFRETGNEDGGARHDPFAAEIPQGD